MKFYPYEEGGRQSFSHAEGGPQKVSTLKKKWGGGGGGA